MKWTWTRRTQHKIWLVHFILARANLSEMNFPETPLRCATGPTWGCSNGLFV
jgi:hypothetical protein